MVDASRVHALVALRLAPPAYPSTHTTSAWQGGRTHFMVRPPVAGSCVGQLCPQAGELGRGPTEANHYGGPQWNEIVVQIGCSTKDLYANPDGEASRVRQTTLGLVIPLALQEPSTSGQP